MPYPAFEQSARCLDWRRLGKQRLEAREILRILRGKESRWKNHPAVKMWRGYDKALAAYYNAILGEWIRRGYRNRMEFEAVDAYELPPWFGTERFHASHRSNLLRKDFGFYSQFGWAESADLPYEWQ